MIKHSKALYNAKILLFGEYAVIYGGMAITIPYTYYSGYLSFIGENKSTHDIALKSAQDILQYRNYYQENSELKRNVALDLDRLSADLNRGLYFESSIPQGYGVGSSGALIAALYQEYALEPVKPVNQSSLKELKSKLALMESFFHGTSSGMDPLNCLVGKPLLFKGNGDILKVNLPGESDISIFLVNTGEPAVTGPLVSYFLDKTSNKKYLDTIRDYLLPLNTQCITNWIEEKKEIFFKNIQDLSVFQLDYFETMIPSQTVNLWKKGIDSRDFTLKLCGSGGGGFVLGFTRDYLRAQKSIKEYGLEVLPVKT